MSHLFGAIQIIRDTFLTPPPRVTFLFSLSVILKPTTHSTMKWSIQKAYIKPFRYLAVRQTFYFKKAFETVFKKAKIVCVTLCRPPPFECHVLFDWPLRGYFSITDKNSEITYKELQIRLKISKSTFHMETWNHSVDLWYWFFVCKFVYFFDFVFSDNRSKP